jgi:DNA polymerase-3 subunit epsilon
MLDLNRAALEEQLAAPSPAQRFQTECLQGKTVCFTGELLGLLDGERITRKTAEAMAVQAGLEVLPNVTRRLDILVVADPHTQSGKAEKARQYGTRVLAETAFWKAIGAKIE